MKQQKISKDKSNPHNPYVYQIYKELIKTFDQETLKQKMKSNMSVPAFDDHLLVKANRALPKVGANNDNQKEPIRQVESRRGRDIGYYYKKLLKYEENIHKQKEMKSSGNKRRNQISNKFIVSFATIDNNTQNKLEKMDRKTYQHSLDLNTLNTIPNSEINPETKYYARLTQKPPEIKISQLKKRANRYTLNQQHQDTGHSHKRKRNYSKKVVELKIFEKNITERARKQRPTVSLPPKTLRQPSQKSSNLIQTNKESQLANQKPSHISHFNDHNFISKQKLKQPPANINNNPEIKPDEITFQKWRQTIHKKESSPARESRSPRRIFIKKFNWKTQKLPNCLTKIYKQEYQSLIRAYLNIGNISELSFGFFKAYVGPGNNSSIIKKALKQRGYWTIVNSLADSPNFVWTQNPYKQFIQEHNQAQLAIENNNKAVGHEETEETLTSSFKIEQQVEDPELKEFLMNKKNDFLSGYQKILSPKTYSKYMNLLKDRFKTRMATNYLSQVQANIFEYYRCNKQRNSSIIKASDIYTHNHVLGATAISNKKCLFYYITKYCELFDENCWDIIPETFHIDESWTGQEIDMEIKEDGPWILKPGQETNRGQGITIHTEKSDLVQQLKNLNTGNKKHRSGIQYTTIIQKCIDPLLYHGRKFDLRIWVLWSRGQLWWYQQGYGRTSSKQFTYKSTNKYIHLTNDAIQMQCPDYGKHEASNKISFSELQKYLQSVYSYFDFEKIIVAQMKQITIKIFRIANFIFERSSKPKNNHYFDFQLFGLDFLIDSNMKPWLIQCNSNPSLEVNCSLLSRLIANMIDSVISLTVDSYYPPTMKKKPKQPIPWNPESFKFQLLYDSLQDEQMRSQQIKKKLALINFNQNYHKQSEQSRENGSEQICQQQEDNPKENLQ